MCKCILVDKGTAMARIVGQKESSSACQQAIGELQTGIAKATGARLPIDGRKVLD